MKPIQVEVREDCIVLTVPKPDPIVCEGCGRKYEYEPFLQSGSCDWASRSVATDLWRPIIQLQAVQVFYMLQGLAKPCGHIEELEREVWAIANPREAFEPSDLLKAARALITRIEQG